MTSVLSSVIFATLFSLVIGTTEYYGLDEGKAVSPAVFVSSICLRLHVWRWALCVCVLLLCLFVFLVVESDVTDLFNYIFFILHESLFLFFIWSFNWHLEGALNWLWHFSHVVVQRSCSVMFDSLLLMNELWYIFFTESCMPLCFVIGL